MGGRERVIWRAGRNQEKSWRWGGGEKTKIRRCHSTYAAGHVIDGDGSSSVNMY